MRFFKSKRPDFPHLASQLPEDWVCVDEVAAKTFERELRQETVKGHLLFGLTVFAIARRDGMDDILFSLSDGRAALVHLTWANETRPNWPETLIFVSIEDAVAYMTN